MLLVGLMVIPLAFAVSVEIVAPAASENLCRAVSQGELSRGVRLRFGSQYRGGQHSKRAMTKKADRIFLKFMVLPPKYFIFK